MKDEQKPQHLQLVTGGRTRTPKFLAKAWIDKISRAMESRRFPIEKFLLLPGDLGERSKENFMSTQIEVTKTQRGFVFDNLDSVKGALALYETRGSHATQDQLKKDCEFETQKLREAGLPTHNMMDTALAKILMDAMKTSSGFIQKLCRQMVDKLSTGDEFHRSFDYDGPGTFFKTDVDVSHIGRGYYWLRFYAAYVGDRCEEEFTKALRRERETVNYEVAIPLPKRGSDWEGDLSKLLAPFRSVYRDQCIIEDKDIPKDGELSYGTIKLVAGKNYDIRFYIAHLQEHARVTSGTHLTAKVQKNYTGKGDSFMTPKLVFVLGCHGADGSRIPILDPVALGEMPKVAEEIKGLYLSLGKSELKAV